MSTWIFIAAAILANAVTNISLRAAARSVDTSSAKTIAIGLATSPFAWLGVVSGFVLLGTYMAAIRVLPLSVSYAIVTIMSMVALTIWGGLTGTESPNAMRIAGMFLIILGTLALVFSTGSENAGN